MLAEKDDINLVYAASTDNRPYANFGDALSPIIVHLLTGRNIKHVNFDSKSERMASIGTILHNFKHSKLHVWGAGLDVTKNVANLDKSFYDPHDLDISYVIHAVRGIITDQVLTLFGYKTNKIYGDPAILLRKILKTFVGSTRSEKLGVVCHLTELDSYTSDSLAKESLNRYKFEHDEIEFINPLTAPNSAAVLEKVKQIASCSHIVSSSLHGLIIAEAFEVPCSYMSSSISKSGRYSIFDYGNNLDHRFRDFYSGMKEPTMLSFYAPYNDPINAEEVKTFLEREWRPIENFEKTADKLVEAFPMDIVGYRDHTDLPEGLSLLKV